jgi:transposase
MVVRKTKPDRRDAHHLRDLLKDDRFPVVWVPDPTKRERRALLKRRSKGPNSSAVGDLPGR